MDPTLQKHGAKHIYKVPEGLRELCSDISREVSNILSANIKYIAFLRKFNSKIHRCKNYARSSNIIQHLASITFLNIS